MSADLPAKEQDAVGKHVGISTTEDSAQTAEDGAGAEEEDGEEDEDEPKLKYAKLTGSLASVYRNGDSTSAFTVAGDKMVLGTHNGNIHVLSVPSLQSLRTYHAHSATITSVSVSPTPPPPSFAQQPEATGNATLLSPPPSVRAQPATSASPRSQAPLPSTPNNQIHIATSSLDGHVCISSLLDPKDVQLRNFARPVQVVALSTDYRNDRTFLSGGLAGSLILTVGGKAGVTSDANTNSAAAAASSGFLGAFGLGGDKGKDTVMHSGEGAISTIKWSLSGKWVVWVNEEGIKIMRSHIKLGSEDSEDAWRRVAHAAKPNRRSWEDMAGVWKGRCEWVDDRKLESDEQDDGSHTALNGANGTSNVKSTPSKNKQKSNEKLVVGWGDTAWILHITEGGTNAAGKKQVGSADIVHKLQFRDCIVSGISLYTPSLLAILAYRTRDDDDKPIQQQSANDTPRRGRHRQTGLAPQLRLVNVVSGEEDDIDELSISRFETLTAQDYFMATLFIPPPRRPPKDKAGDRRALEGLWDAAGGKYATRIFSSGASVLSGGSSGQDGKASVASPPGSALGVTPSSPPAKKRLDAHPHAAGPGLKLFIQSPYDCILAVKRDLKDHLEFLLKQEDYPQAWQLLDKHPHLNPETPNTTAPSPSSTPSKGGGSLADFLGDESTSQGATEASASQKEKQRIGELWLQQLVSSNRWSEAGRVAGKILGGSSRWEHWVWTFAQANRFNEITRHIPADAVLPSLVYEVVLGHYISADRQRLKDLLDAWEPDRGLYDTGSIEAAIENRLNSGDDEEDSEDWKILMDSLARLYLADGRPQEALRCYIRAQSADRAMELMREEKLMDVIAAEDVPGLLMLRISKDQMRNAPLSELDDASREAVQLLVDEAHKGSVMPATVIQQIEARGKPFQPFLYFYFRALWKDAPQEETPAPHRPRGRMFALRINEGHALVEDHADLAVELFAEYDRDLLMTFLRASEVYNYEKAATLCERRNYIPELVYVLSKTGQTKRALSLIIDTLQDVSQAIQFTKENPDLWDDLLEYSMDKPPFIRGLLEEVGTAIDPIQLIKRIPTGLEIEGLKDGVVKMMQEFDLQVSISEGVARVLRGEVAERMDWLRDGQKKAVKFEVLPTNAESEKVDAHLQTKVEGDGVPTITEQAHEHGHTQSPDQAGHCIRCSEVFSEEETEPLIGFACGHVYHLSCLLKANPETADPNTIRQLLKQLGGSGSGEEAESYSGRSVGAKVAHAHIIKHVLRGGCRVCGRVDD